MSKLYLVARDFLIDAGLKNVIVLNVNRINYTKIEFYNSKNKNKKNEEYEVYCVEYTCSFFNSPRHYNIKCDKLDNYVLHRVKKIKEIFKDDTDFTF